MAQKRVIATLDKLHLQYNFKELQWNLSKANTIKISFREVSIGETPRTTVCPYIEIFALDRIHLKDILLYFSF